MSNDVLIRVRVRQDTRDGFAAIAREAEKSAQESADRFTARFGVVFSRVGTLLAAHTRNAGGVIGQQLGEHAGQNFITRMIAGVNANAQKYAQLGQNIGQRVGDSISSEITQSIFRSVRNGDAGDSRSTFRSSSRSAGGGSSRSDSDFSNRGRSGGKGGDGGTTRIDVDRQSFLSRIAGWGTEAAKGFYGNFSGALSTLLSGDLISTLVKVFSVTSIATALSIPLAAAFSSAVLLALGGGVIAAGIAGAFKDPRITAAAKELGTKLEKAFTKFGEPFRGPVANFFERLVRDFMPQLEKAGKEIGKVFAPLTGKLGDGIIGALQNILPGLTDGLKGAAPVIEVLAKRLPDIGQAIGDFFSIIGENGDSAAVFFNDLITVVNGVITAVARLISTLTGLYGGFRDVAMATLELFKAIWNFIEELTDSLAASIVGAFRRMRSGVQSTLTGLASSGANALNRLWNAIGSGVNRARAFFRSFVSYAISMMGSLLNGAIAALSWIPGIGGKLAVARAAFSRFKSSVIGDLNAIPKSKTVTINGINNVGYAVGSALRSIARLTATNYVGITGKYTGGVTGSLPAEIGRAASGGIRNGLTLVGEYGPELVDVAPGSKVYSNGDSARMMRGGSDGGALAVQASWVGTADPLIREIMNSIQFQVVRRYNGSVQSAMGR